MTTEIHITGVHANWRKQTHKYSIIQTSQSKLCSAHTNIMQLAITSIHPHQTEMKNYD